MPLFKAEDFKDFSLEGNEQADADMFSAIAIDRMKLGFTSISNDKVAFSVSPNQKSELGTKVYYVLEDVVKDDSCKHQTSYTGLDGVIVYESWGKHGHKFCPDCGDPI